MMDRLEVNLEVVTEALAEFDGIATAHEVNGILGANNPWDKERIFKILSTKKIKIPIDKLDRDYSVGGGRAKWAYANQDVLDKVRALISVD
jgi:hypothetical protein